MKIKFNFAFSLFMVIFFTWIIVEAAGYPEEARLIPFVISIPGLLLSVIQLIVDLTKIKSTESKKKSAPDPNQQKYGGEEYTVKDEVPPEEVKKKELLMFAWMFGSVACILIFGFWISIFAILLLFTRLYGKESWKLCLYMAVGGWVSIYVVFTLVLEVPLFKGFLFGAV